MKLLITEGKREILRLFIVCLMAYTVTASVKWCYAAVFGSDKPAAETKQADKKEPIKKKAEESPGLLSLMQPPKINETPKPEPIKPYVTGVIKAGTKEVVLLSDGTIIREWERRVFRIETHRVHLDGHWQYIKPNSSSVSVLHTAALTAEAPGQRSSGAEARPAAAKAAGWVN